MRVTTTWVANALATLWARAGDGEVAETATRLLCPIGVAVTESSSVDGVSFKLRFAITACATGVVVIRLAPLSVSVTGIPELCSSERPLR